MPSAIPADSRIPANEFATQCRGQMIPLSKTLAYFSVLPLDEGELQRLIYDPASAIPPRLFEIVPKLRIVVVPYLEKPSTKNGDGGDTPVISFKAPARTKRMVSGTYDVEDETFLFLSIRDEDVADAHYILYQKLAEMIVRRAPDADIEPFHELIKKELRDGTHGEIDERSWALKDDLLRKQKDPTRETRTLAEYRDQALEDTLTLYLHGLCCDIDVSAGPRQLASSHIRKRLLLLRDSLPPPPGVALFPEELPIGS